jgi:hypothetical protein
VPAWPARPAARTPFSWSTLVCCGVEHGVERDAGGVRRRGPLMLASAGPGFGDLERVPVAAVATADEPGVVRLDTARPFAPPNSSRLPQSPPRGSQFRARILNHAVLQGVIIHSVICVPRANSSRVVDVSCLSAAALSIDWATPAWVDAGTTRRTNRGRARSGRSCRRAGIGRRRGGPRASPGAPVAARPRAIHWAGS